MSRSVLRMAGLCLVSSCLVSVLHAADDPAPAGSEWVGIFKRVNLKDKDISTTDIVVKIKERDGDKFKGELWIDRRERGLQVEGTITSLGGFRCTPTKVIKGGFADDIIGRAKVLGSVKDGKMKAEYQIGNAVRFGEFEAKLKDPMNR